MAVTLTVRDETASGSVTSEMPLEFPTEVITIRELIRERVYQEVQDFNRSQEETVFRGLVQPTDTEQILNGKQQQTGFRMKKRRDIDWKEQFEKALASFETNGFLILIDNQQAENLDDQFTVSAGSEVSFLKLTPLVGG